MVSITRDTELLDGTVWGSPVVMYSLSPDQVTKFSSLEEFDEPQSMLTKTAETLQNVSYNLEKQYIGATDYSHWKDF